ncbi:thiol:disulfide interchange protein DsbA/DsbL [Lysobacter fragariae]
MNKRFALLLALLMPIAGFAAPAPTPVEGEDYQVIENGKPLAPLAGKIEVVEVFGYWCPHCADFQPLVTAWEGKLGKDVRLSYLPLPNGDDDALSRGFFATQAAGTLKSVHEAVFRAIHDDRTLPRNPSVDELATFYGTLGMNAERTASLMNSPSITAQLKPAWDFAIHAGVEGTPTLIVNGKYRVAGRQFADMLRIADYLIARERAARRR